MKILWTERKNKRQTQSKILEHIKQKNLITLGGSNFANYLSLIPKCVEHITSYEMDQQEYISQLIDIHNVDRNVNIILGNIMEAEIQENTFYDLDFKCTLPSVAYIIQKFQNCPFSITFSYRPYKIESIPPMFSKIMGEKLIKIEKKGDKKLIITNKKAYKYYHYCDKSPMGTITNI